MAATDRVRIAAVSDVHYRREAPANPHQVIREALQAADILVLCGDLTDHGLPEEAHQLVRDLENSDIPMLAVLGNHDYEAGRCDEVCAILAEGGVRVLDGEAFEVEGIGFAGTKGFGGGFGRRTLEPWGESTIKQFVQEAVNEAMKLELALARLRTPQRIALLHYAPVQSTVEGEPPEIFAFLGSSRLEEPLDRYEVTAAFHGHAHRGTLQGATRGGVPVFNISLPLLRRDFPDRPPFYLYEVPREPPAGSE